MTTPKRFSIFISIFLFMITLINSSLALNDINDTKFICPVDSGKISERFGMRIHPILKVERHHDGIDILLPIGSPVHSILKGEIIFTGTKAGYGKSITIMHENGTETFYSHLQNIDVKENQHVKLGEQIGSVGNSGLSSIPHLHFEIKRDGELVDPLLFIDSKNLTY